MFDHDPIAFWFLTSVAGGLAVHVAAAWVYRRSYARLRGAYVAAVAHVQRTGADPDALVRAQELHRQFMRARIPRWALGLGVHLRNALVIGAVVGLALATAFHRIEPVLVGVVLLFAIGLRRILLVTALLLAVFAATGLSSQRHYRVDRSVAARVEIPRASSSAAATVPAYPRADRSR
jgi:hypothetical protein